MSVEEQLSALMEKYTELQAENKEKQGLIDRLCSQKPCPKCGYGITGACYGCEITKLQAELDKHRWIPVDATSDNLPKRPDFWGKKIWVIINGKPDCVKYFGYRIGMTHWQPIILPKPDGAGKSTEAQKGE